MTQIDVWAATLIDTTSGTSHTPNPATPTAGNVDCAIVLISALAVANGTTAITFTAPTNWTLIITSSEPGAAGSLSSATAVAFRDGRTSTVTPPAFTTNVATVADVYMVLAGQSGPTLADAPTGIAAPTGAIVESYSSPTPIIPLPPVVPTTGGVILCDSLGNEVADLEVDHTIRFEVSRSYSVTFTLGYDQDGASELLDMLGDEIPLLHVYRNKELIFRGFWAPQQETADGTASDGITCEFRSPFSRLETRYLSTGFGWTDTDQGDIAWGFVDMANTDSPTGLQRGAHETTLNRNREYQAGQQVASAITDLTDLVNGVTFTETFLPPTTGGNLAAFNVWANLGRDLTLTAPFEYGETTLENVLSVSRTITYPANRVIATGGTALAVSVAEDLTSQDAFGLYAVTQDFSNIQQNQDALDDAAAALVQPYPVQQITFEPDVVGAPQPIDDYWLGDTISFRADQDEFQVSATAPITAFEIDRDSAGNELAHRIEFGVQTVQPLEVIRRGRRIVMRDKARQSLSALPSPARFRNPEVPGFRNPQVQGFRNYSVRQRFRNTK